jgi:hypothetical protein
MHEFSDKPLAGEGEVLLEQEERLRLLFDGLGAPLADWVPVATEEEEEDEDWDDDDEDWDDDDDDWDDDDEEDDADD